MKYTFPTARDIDVLWILVITEKSNPQNDISVIHFDKVSSYKL